MNDGKQFHSCVYVMPAVVNKSMLTYNILYPETV